VTSGTARQLGRVLLTTICLGILGLGYWVWLPNNRPGMWGLSPFVGLVLALTLGKRADAKLTAKFAGQENTQVPRWVRVAQFVLSWLPVLFAGALCLEMGKYVVKSPG
jgi:hypothetical protein